MSLLSRLFSSTPVLQPIALIIAKDNMAESVADRTSFQAIWQKKLDETLVQINEAQEKYGHTNVSVFLGNSKDAVTKALIMAGYKVTDADEEDDMGDTCISWKHFIK